jgi:hypothetical protein
MATISTISSTDNSLHVRYDRSQIFLGDLKTISGEILLNSTSGTLTYAVGTLLGRVTASGKLVPLASGASNGSQYPVGFLTQEVTLAASGEDYVTVAIAGNVDSTKITLAGSDTLATTITNNGGRSIKDAIHGDTQGIYLIPVREISKTDNQ